jgi:hypothetical protein
MTRLRANVEVQFQFWELINWLFVSVYWTALYDVGQLSTYDINDSGQTVQFPTGSNIFVNETLFKEYASYFENTVAPFAGTLLAPDALTFDQPLEAVDTQIVKSYQCVEQRLRSPFSLIISIIVADYALIGLPFAIVLWFAAQFEQRRRRRDCKSLPRDADSVNHCEGCVELERGAAGDMSDISVDANPGRKGES